MGAAERQGLQPSSIFHTPRCPRALPHAALTPFLAFSPACGHPSHPVLPHHSSPFLSVFCPWAGRATICNGGNTRIGVFGPPIRPSSGESPRTLRQRVPALRASPSTTRASGEDGHRPELLRESGGDDRHSTVMQMAAGVMRAGHANSTGLMFVRTFEVRLVHCLQCGGTPVFCMNCMFHFPSLPLLGPRPRPPASTSRPARLPTILLSLGSTPFCGVQIPRA